MIVISSALKWATESQMAGMIPGLVLHGSPFHISWLSGEVFVIKSRSYQTSLNYREFMLDNSISIVGKVAFDWKEGCYR